MPITAVSQRLPVTVVTGLTGAGKSTLLRHLLEHSPELRAAVIRSNGNWPTPEQPLPKGSCCICTEEKTVHLATKSGRYTLRADLLQEAGRLAREDQFDYLLIENPALAALEPVVRTFRVNHPAYGFDLPQRARLDTVVAVVDAAEFFADWHAAAEKPNQAHEEPVPWFRADVLTAQVEAANVVVLNKTDQISPEELGRVWALLRQLNPAARLLTAAFGQVHPAELLNTGRYCPAAAKEPAAAVALPAAYGISSWRFREARPFHPERLWQFVRQGWPKGLLRSQGLFWLASRPENVMRWDQAGPSRRAATVGRWWAATPDRAQHPVFQREELALLARWHPEFHDRVNTLHFIGQDLDEVRLRADLVACLCTPLEIGRWRRGAIFPDPWPHE